ncbi:UNVERIFIED_CONTAM: hypothetical protein GTU68_002605 [Idotea baltica]|nr:hypothetical protein [Idotea baltica]
MPLKAYFTKGISEAGCDEAGRGCLAGPVTAAAVILDPKRPIQDLNDSKLIKAKDRDRLRILIEQHALAYAVAFVSVEEIDEINILNASILAMQNALDQLSIPFEHIIVDGNRFKSYYSDRHKTIVPYTTIVKGDAKFASIAAASILAKTYRDDFMQKIDLDFPAYGWQQNKGYPTKAHRSSIKLNGPCIWHRKSYKLT